MATRSKRGGKSVEALVHESATRPNIPSAELHPLVPEDERDPIRVAYERRNRDLDPQLVWRGKDQQDWSDLVVQAPPLYIQEKVHPKVLIDDLLRRSESEQAEDEGQPDLFADFNGVPDGDARTEFYQHDANWTNRMILGDSLQVMASLAEREGLRGKVQCIYLDPPYGIKFNSNFQWSTTSRDVKDGNAAHITREPEQVKAFRDTWRDGIHSYLTYLRDRLTVARDLLTDSGSIFVQIGDENVHRVRALMDELFGEENFISNITFAKTTSASGKLLSSIADYIVWFAKDKPHLKYRQLLKDKVLGGVGASDYTVVRLPNGQIRSLTPAEIADPKTLPEKAHIFTLDNITSQRPAGNGDLRIYRWRNRDYAPGKGTFKTDRTGLERLNKAERVGSRGSSLRYIRLLSDFSVVPFGNVWLDTVIAGSRTGAKVYVVQTAPDVVERCILMASDPGDLVLDPTCGSGTTAYVAEQWGRRWITIDTSRVALALARARIMGARYPYYLLADSPEGQQKEGEITRSAPSTRPTRGDIRHGFVYERVPHIMLSSITSNAEIDVIYERFQEEMEPIRARMNELAGTELEEWQIRRSPGDPWTPKAIKQWKRFRKVKTDTTKQKAVNRINEILGRDYTIETLPKRPVDPWTDPELLALHERWWELRIERQKEIDASIAAKADSEFLYDRPYEDRGKVRVAGPFTVESLMPHRVLGVDENDELIEAVNETGPGYGAIQDFTQMILENLRMAGVQQAHKEDRIQFSSLTPWPGRLVCAEGRYTETRGENGGATDGDGAVSTAPIEKRAGIFIGPEFGTVSRPDLVEAAREAADAGFDVLVSCAFNYDAHSSEFSKLGKVPVLKARMNADLHMAGDLKNTGAGNLFVIFGEPDIDILAAEDDDQIRVRINGVDVFHPNTGEVRSDGADGIACWFIDTDYNAESFFVRQAYFLGANDPYKALKTTLKAEIDEDAWATLNSDVSRPFPKPGSGRIAVKVINHLGDEVMKVFRV